MNVVLAKDAQKQYSRLPKPEQIKIKKKLALLSQDPYAGKKLEGVLKGRRTIRAWPYRIIYTINEREQRVEVSVLNIAGSVQIVEIISQFSIIVYTNGYNEILRLFCTTNSSS